MARLYSFLFYSSVLSAVTSVSITDIQGSAWLSPLNGQKVSDVTGVVTAKASNGFYIQGEKSSDIRKSHGLFVFSSNLVNNVTVGDLISLNGEVSEYRPNGSPNNLFITEIVSPTDLKIISKDNQVAPLVLGKDRSPPTRKFTALDRGADGFLSVPNNQSTISGTNAQLNPTQYGLDFWESLEGQLVTIPKPVATNFENQYGEFWAYGDWPITGKNKRGGITLTFGPDGVPDGNPEAVMIGKALDGTKLPKTAVGMGLSDITGVVHYQFGFFYVLPLTAPTVIKVPDQNIAATTLTSKTEWSIWDPFGWAANCLVTFGGYNVENMSPKSAHIPAVAGHIGKLMLTPDVLFLQEVQDNSGPTDDGVVSANQTLQALADAIANITGVKYAYASVDPEDKQDGGAPGGNIRTAFFYRPEKLKLAGSSASVAGGATDSTKVDGFFLFPKLSVNPGRIDPTNSVWASTRKPLVAHWQTVKGNHNLFTINLHLSSKGGSSSTQGDARPPVNNPIENRSAQVKTVAVSLSSSCRRINKQPKHLTLFPLVDFVKSLLAKDPLANIVVAGDYNEFTQTRSVYAPLTSVMTDIDEAANIPPVERYSYVFDQNSQQLDHALISNALRLRKVEYDHIHVNTWSPSYSARISDHDPSVGRIRLC